MQCETRTERLTQELDHDVAALVVCVEAIRAEFAELKGLLKGKHLNQPSAPVREERLALFSGRLDRFWDECVDASDPEAVVRRGELYKAARKWCRERGYDGCSNTGFSDMLKRKGIRIERRQLGGVRNRYYVGIKLR